MSVDRRVWTLMWKDASFAIDTDTQVITSVARPPDRTPLLDLEVPGYRTCRRIFTIDERVVLACNRVEDGRIETLLWSPAARTIHSIDMATSRGDAVSRRELSSVNATWVRAMFDWVRGRWLRVDEGLLGVPTELHSARRFYGMSADGRELRRYDLDAATYEVVRSYDAKACAGLLGVVAFAEDGRYVAVGCALPSVKNPRHSTHVWSEVIDRESRRTWRTDKFVERFATGSIVLLTDRRLRGGHRDGASLPRARAQQPSSRSRSSSSSVGGARAGATGGTEDRMPR